MYWSAIDMFQTADYWNRKWIVGKYVCVCVCARAYKRVGISYMYVSVLYPRIWDVGLVCRVVFMRLYIYIYIVVVSLTPVEHIHTRLFHVNLKAGLVLFLWLNWLISNVGNKVFNEIWMMFIFNKIWLFLYRYFNSNTRRNQSLHHKIIFFII